MISCNRSTRSYFIVDFCTVANIGRKVVGVNNGRVEVNGHGIHSPFCWSALRWLFCNLLLCNKRYKIQREYNNSVWCARSTTIDVPVQYTSTSNNDQWLVGGCLAAEPNDERFSIDPQSAKEKWRPAFLMNRRNEEPGFWVNRKMKRDS